MSEPLFSVIVATYGRPAYLAETLASIQAQTVSDFECIVVDDASPDPATVPADPRFRLLRRTENGGWPASRNDALAVARGRYLTFLDDDDAWTPDRLELGRRGVGRAPVSVCYRRGMDGSTGGNRLLEGNVHDRILDALTPQIGQVTVAREVMVPFDPRFIGCADVEWWLRLSEHPSLSTVPEVGLLYRVHDAPRNNNGTRVRIRFSHELLREHAGYFATHPRAAAFRWKRIGLMSMRVGDARAARAAFRRSLRLHPELKTVAHLTRALRAPRAAATVADAP